MESITLGEALRQTQALVNDSEDRAYGDLGPAMADMAKCMLEGMAHSEVEKRVGVRLYERGEERTDYRNGTRERGVQLPFAYLRIEIPRLRGGGYVPSFLDPGHRAVREVEEYVAKGLLLGISRADIIRYMADAGGCRPSDRLIERVVNDLDRLAREFKERRLTKKYVYLFLDAAWAKDIVGVNATRVCILTAVAVTEDGEKEILGFERVIHESETAWRGFLSRLRERGVNPNALSLVISDEHKGIEPAVAEVFGDVAYQLCWAHRIRNIFKATDKADRPEMVAGLRSIMRAAHKTAARRAFRIWASRWKEKYPSLVANTQQDLGKLLRFYDCPKKHWQYIRTTNPIERCFLELRRRRFGCGAFANTRSCDRVVFGVFSLLNRLWEGKSIWMKPVYRQA
jgi:putative transposase